MENLNAEFSAHDLTESDCIMKPRQANKIQEVYSLVI
jgi:hypothetical protein